MANNKTCPGGRLENAKLSLLQTGEEGPGRIMVSIKIDLSGTIPHELILNVVRSEGKLKVIWDRKPAAAA